jgi:hypothetical protein
MFQSIKLLNDARSFPDLGLAGLKECFMKYKQKLEFLFVIILYPTMPLQFVSISR